MSLTPSAGARFRQALKDESPLQVVGTINATAHRGQAELVNAVLKQGTPLIAIALRMPYDLAAYPEVSTYTCTYSILSPAMEALAAAFWGRIPFGGQVPVTIPRKLSISG